MLLSPTLQTPYNTPLPISASLSVASSLSINVSTASLSQQHLPANYNNKINDIKAQRLQPSNILTMTPSQRLQFQLTQIIPVTAIATTHKYQLSYNNINRHRCDITLHQNLPGIFRRRLVPTFQTNPRQSPLSRFQSVQSNKWHHHLFPIFITTTWDGWMIASIN